VENLWKTLLKIILVTNNNKTAQESQEQIINVEK